MMSLKNLFLIGSIFLNPFSIIHQHNRTYNINGMLNVKNGEKIFLVIPYPEYLVDSTIVNQNQFHFRGEIEEPMEATLVFENLQNLENAKKAKRFSLEPRRIKIEGDEIFFQKSKVKGSIYNKDLDNYYNFISRELRQAGYYKKTASATRQTDFSNLRDSLTLIFAKENPNSYKSAMEVFFMRKRISTGSLKQLYQSFTTNTKAHYFGKLISKFIENYHDQRLGAMAPDFTLPSIDSDSITLSSFRGRYVLVSFWGTWCVPCRIENSHLNELYKVYHSRGLEILGVALDSKEDLKQVIDSSKIEFPNVYSKNSLDSSIMYSYGISSVPSNILIDKDGRIIAKNLIIQLPDGRFEPIFEKILENK